MSFAWRRINLFGLAMSIPAVAFLIRKSEEQITAFAEHREDIAACDSCHKFFNYARWTSMTQHLQDSHKIDSDKAIFIVADLAKRLLILKWKKDSASEEL